MLWCTSSNCKNTLFRCSKERTCPLVCSQELGVHVIGNKPNYRTLRLLNLHKFNFLSHFNFPHWQQRALPEWRNRTKLGRIGWLLWENHSPVDAAFHVIISKSLPKLMVFMAPFGELLIFSAAIRVTTKSGQWFLSVAQGFMLMGWMVQLESACCTAVDLLCCSCWKWVVCLLGWTFIKKLSS